MRHRPALGAALDGALTDVRRVLDGDDPHIAENLLKRRTGRDERAHSRRNDRLLDDPRKLREMRKRGAERREACTYPMSSP